MSASAASTNRPQGGAGHSTRQQLDELDALLQRMLDLPVNPADPAGERSSIGSPPVPERKPVRSPIEPPRTYPPSYMVVETSTPADLAPRSNAEPPPPDWRSSTVLESPVPGGAHDLISESSPPSPSDSRGDWVPFRSSWQPSAQTWKPLAETWQQAARGTPTQEPVSPFAPTIPSNSIIPPSPEPPPSESPAPPADPSHPLILLPIVWVNRAFEACVKPLGPLGRWLSGPSGRGFLGTVGLLCIVAAIAYVLAEGIGWFGWIGWPR